jgi:hypothetical protein
LPPKKAARNGIKAKPLACCANGFAMKDALCEPRGFSHRIADGDVGQDPIANRGRQRAQFRRSPNWRLGWRHTGSAQQQPDPDEFLPTVHGFDEFFGNLYHLNAEDEPEHPDYPKGPAFKERFGPRGVLKCFATTAETPGDDSRWGPWGKQK